MNNELEKELEKVTSKFQTFTTNQGRNTLRTKIEKLLKKGDKKYFDILVGYFYISGFNLIYELTKKIEKIRILIGIKTEKNVVEAVDFKQKVINNIIDDWNTIKTDNVNIYNLLEMFQEERLEIKIVENRDNHSKLYILRDEEKPIDEVNGAVIIGSSNLTYNGLIKHFELNVVLKDERDIDEATQIFNLLWEKASDNITLEDVEQRIIPKLKNYTPKKVEIHKENITSYQAYIKILQTYFDNRIDIFNFDSKDMPKNFKSFRYQLDAVQDGINKLEKYNGFYLADVVGLGKTIIAILIIKKLHLKTLIIAPNSVLNQWQKAIKDYNITNIETIVSKDNIPESTTAELIVIDEAHNFRNNETIRYEKLEHICKYPYQKKVMLLSATPQNNEPNDIANQIYLFQNQNNSNIPNLLKLKDFFDKKQKAYKDLINNRLKDDKEIEESIEDISKEIKEKVLKYIMTRRIRADIESHQMYKNDIENFPKLKELVSLEYDLKDKDLIKKYNETAKSLQDKLQYARFKALNKLNKKGRKKYKTLNPLIPDNIFDENKLSTLMKIQLIKRFESSFEAFKISIDRHTRRLEKFIEYFEKDEIYLGNRSNEFLDDNIGKFKISNDEVIYGKTQIRTLKGHIFKKDDFENDFLDLLKEDLKVFKELNEKWKNEKRDPKFELFKKELEKYQNTNTKIVVFTESQDTGKYLYKNLNDNFKILYVDSKNRDEKMTDIMNNFDANINKEKQKNDYNIIITTDTLAEGINLHRSNIIYNYDIPWNATKLMQRIGRINRIGSKSDNYYVYNFKPIAQTEKIIELSHKAYTKLQSFHSTYGEDNKIYSDLEKVESKELFDTIEEIDKDEELGFLQELRDYKEKYPKKFEMITKLDNNILMNIQNNKIAYVYKKGTISHKFYKIDKEIEEIDFVTFASNIKKISNNKKITVDKNQAKEIKKQVDEFYQKNTVEEIQMQRNSTKNNDPKIGQAIRILKQYGRERIITKELYKNIMPILKSGVYTNFAKKIINSNKDNIIEILNNNKQIPQQSKEIDREDMEFIITYTKDL